MGSQNYLAIYISRDTATAVCADSQDKTGRILGSFSVSVEQQEQEPLQALAALVARGCNDRQWVVSEVAVALDCAMFMQHNVHSEFSDVRQITNTARFDTEEALATDITDLAIAFQINSTNQTGSELTVFTAKHKILSDIILSLQSNNIDPASIEPDVTCLSRFVCRKFSSAESGPDGTLFGLLSGHSGYLIAPPVPASTESRTEPVVRTFLVGPKQDRGQLLEREMLVTTALAGSRERMTRARLFDSAGSLDYHRIGARLDIEASRLDLAAAEGIEPGIVADHTDPVGFAIACGAVLAHFDKTGALNFRNDFMPYQGKRLILQNTLKFLSIAVTILLIAGGLYFQTQLYGVNKFRSRLNKCLARDYFAVMPTKEPPRISYSSSLRAEVRRIKSTQMPQDPKGDKSILGQLATVLQAFNKCAAQTSLNIDSVSVSDKSITIRGDTSSKNNTLLFMDTIRKSGLDVQKESGGTKAGRDTFSITAVPIR